MTRPASGRRVRAFEGDQAFAAQTYVAIEPDGLDPCDLRLRKGDAAVRELVGRRVPLYRFVLGNVLERYDLDRADGRVDALRAAARLVVSVRDKSKVESFVRELSGQLGMEIDEVRAEVFRAASRPRPEKEADRGPVTASSGEPAPRRAPVANPREPRYAVEWESLKLVLQFPHLVRAHFDELGDEDFTHPWLASVRGAIAKAGGPASAQPGEAWIVAVRDALGADELAAVIGALAVEPLHVDRDPEERYAAAYLARLQELTCLRRIADVKSKLQRTNPVDATDAYNKMFGELIALEKYRTELRERAIGGPA